MAAVTSYSSDNPATLESDDPARMESAEWSTQRVVVVIVILHRQNEEVYNFSLY